MSATRQAEILTVPLPQGGLSAAQYRALEEALQDWETDVRAAVASYPKESYQLGVQQTLAFLRMLGRVGQADLPPAGIAGTMQGASVEWLERYTLSEIDGALSKYVDEIKNAVLYGLRGGVNPVQVASWLYKATRDAQVNWRTIARTEMARANAAGRLDAVQQMGYDRVWIPPHTGACKTCKRLLEDKVFTIEQLRNATNYGRKPKDWIAALPLHPHCRHVPLPYLPDVVEESRHQADLLAENGLDDRTLDEMFDSSGQLKPEYEGDPRIEALFDEAGKTVDPLEFALGNAIAKTARREPPGLHHTSGARSCRLCMSHNGVKCDRFNWKVDDDEVCDDWEPSDDPSVEDEVYRHWPGLVGKGYFDNPQLDLDPLIWDRNRRLRADVRDRIVQWWRHTLTADAPLWSRIFLTGGVTSLQWATSTVERDPDLDVQIVVDYDALRKHHPEYAPLTLPELHAALVTQVKAGLEGVEAAPGVSLDAFVRAETTPEQLVDDVRNAGQALYDINRSRWLIDPVAIPAVEDIDHGLILEGLGGALAMSHPEWVGQARQLSQALQEALNAEHPDRDELQRAYTYVHDLRKRAFAGRGGNAGVGNFIWQYLVNYGPLMRVKHLLEGGGLGKVMPLYRWSTSDVAKAGSVAADAGVEHWITVHPNGPGTDGQPVLVRNAADGKSMVVIGGAGGHLNYLRIDRTRQIKPTDQGQTGPVNEPSDDSFENKTPEQLAREETEAQQRMEQAREHLQKIQDRRKEIDGELRDYMADLVNRVGQSSTGEKLGWDDLTAEEQKQLFGRLKASAIHVAVEGPVNKKDVNESGLTIRRDEPEGPDAPEKGTLDSALEDEQELAPETDEQKAAADAEQQAKRKMPVIALATDQADAINRLVAEQRILAKQASKARKIAGGEKAKTDAMALDYTADDVSSAVKNRVGSEQRQRIARDILETAESSNSKKLMDRAAKQGGYDTLDTFAQAVLGDSQINPEVARLLGVSGTAQLIAHKLYGEAKAGRLDIDKAYDALDSLTMDRERDVASRARARALKATEEVKLAMEASKQSGQTSDLAGLCTKTAANSMRSRKLVEAASALGMAIAGLEAASAMKVALQRVVGPGGVKRTKDGAKIRLARGGIDQIRVSGFSGKYQINELAKRAGVDVHPRQVRRLGSGDYELSLDPGKLEHLFRQRKDPRTAVKDQLEKIRTASDLDEAVQSHRQTPGMADVLTPAQAKGKMYLLAAKDPLLGFAPGVGKTHTAIAAAMQLMHDQPDKHHRALIIAPKAVAKDWYQTVLAQGGLRSAQVLGAQFDEGGEERGTNWRKQIDTPADFNIVSYETLRAHPEIAQQLGATIEVGDEIQKAKSEKSDIFRGLKAASHTAEHHWSLTGTGIEKHTGDIHSMLSWGGNAPELGDQATFREKWDKAGQYDHVTGEERIRQFRDGISDRAFFLSAQDAGNDLPPRNADNGGQMHTIPVELSEAHRELLRQKVQEVNETNADLRARRKAGETDSRGRPIRGSLPFGGRDAVMRALHKPEGIAVEDHAIAQKVADIAEQNPGFDYDGAKTGGQHAGHYDGKTVVFAEQVGHLAIVKKALEARGIKVFEGHSSASMETGKQLSNADNSNNIADFLKHPGKAVFLSSDKNNAGVNLQLGVAKGQFQHGATRVVHLTLPANNARIDQREARIHRKGSVAPADTYAVSANTPFELSDRDRLTQERRRMDLLGNREDEVRTPGGENVRTMRQRYTESGGKLATQQEDEDERAA